MEGVIVQVLQAGAPVRKPDELATPGLVAKTLTDGEGKYRFVNLRPGDYTVRMHLPDRHLYHNQGRAIRIEAGRTNDTSFQVAPFRKGQWRRYSSANGLPSNFVFDLQCMPDGSLWFATLSGIHRYDEEVFVGYTRADGLPEENVAFSAPSPNGSLWLSNGENSAPYLARFELTSTNRWGNRFVTASSEGLDANAMVFALQHDAKGRLWLGGVPPLRGLWYYDPEAAKRSEQPFRELPAPAMLKEGLNLALHIDSKQTVWTGKFDKGLYLMKMEDVWNGKAVARRVDGVTNWVAAIYEDSKGAIWTAPRYRLGPISRVQGNQVQHFSRQTTDGGIPSEQVFCFQEGSGGYLHVGMMGGEIAVESEPGKGSAFTVILPREVKSLSEPEATPVKASGSRTFAGATVLVIDDDPSVLDLMERFLSKEGLCVETAASGIQGLELARRLKPDVITLDAMMPGMDGWAVLSALKSDPVLAGIPVIMVTILDDKQMGFALGATDFVTKPIEWTRLGGLLKKYRKSTTANLVLVVEDDPATREILQRQLEKEGWEVATAEHGGVALQKVEQRMPGVILLDLMMPEMDGFDFLQELRQRPAGRQVPVIVITAKELTEEDRRRLNGYVSKVLAKGAYKMDELLQEIRALVARTA